MAAKKFAGAKRFVNNSNFLLLALLMVAILFLLIAFGPFSANNLGLLSKKQQNQESHAALLPPGGGSSAVTPPCIGVHKVMVGQSVNYPYGDVDGDGKVTSLDSLLILKVTSGSPPPSPSSSYPNRPAPKEFYERADVGGKVGVESKPIDVSADDARLVLRYGAGLEKTFPACGGHTLQFDFDNP